MASSIHQLAKTCILSAEVEDKLSATATAIALWRSGQAGLIDHETIESFAQPGLPKTMQLVKPAKLHKRSMATRERKAALIHALVHIEFNAISLAWDAVYRFRGLSRTFYDDWIGIAEEEAYHFRILNEHLQTLGTCYGALPGHNGLWDIARQTDNDLLARMALVPRVMEARGLDVTPGLIKRLRDNGDTRGAEILEIVLADEIGHVKIGSRWFRFVCQQRKLDPETTFVELVRTELRSKVRKPLHREARLQAGFSQQELTELEKLADN